MKTKTINLLKHQAQFLTTKEKYVGLIGGVGSGKTFSGSHFAIGEIAYQPETLGFIGANTYSQLEQATMKALFNELEALEIEFKYNQNKGILTVGDAEVLCKSMDNFDMIRGIEIGWFWLDEARDLKQEAFDMMIGRLRCKKAKRLRGRVTTTPAGYNWIYDYFHKDGDSHTKEFKLITASSSLNKYLPEGYVKTLEAMYTDEFYRQEVLGEFVRGGSGMVFPWIARADRPKLEDVLPPDLNKWQILVALDPASTSTFGVVFAFWNEYTKKIIVFDEIYESRPDMMTAREINKAVENKLSPWVSKVKSVEWIYDEAAAWFMNEMYELNPNRWLNPSRKSEYGVDGYINLVRAIMNLGMVTITSNVENFWKEFEMYERDENGRIPKADDHLINAFQYMCGYLGLDFNELAEPKVIDNRERRAYSINEDLGDFNSYKEIT